jgi:uncharacterized membrane protein YkvA (DUF1232 family)
MTSSTEDWTRHPKFGKVQTAIAGSFFCPHDYANLWRLRMNKELQNFITEGARRITPAHLDKLVRLLPNIRLAITQVTEFPDLPDQVEFLAEIIEDFHAGLNRSIPFTGIAESAFALFYLRKVTDIIPDSIPGAGFVDDAAIISAVFENYKKPFLKHILARNARKTIEHDPDPDPET